MRDMIDKAVSTATLKFVRKELALAHRKQPPKFPEGRNNSPRLQQSIGTQIEARPNSLQPTIPATLPAAPTEKKKPKPKRRKILGGPRDRIPTGTRIGTTIAQARRTSLLASVDRL
jgi:hypothetical protein